jgi:hypothetical protein
VVARALALELEQLFVGRQRQEFDEVISAQRRRVVSGQAASSAGCCRADTPSGTVESASFPPARYWRAVSEKNVETVRRVYEGVNARLEAPRDLFDPADEFDNKELWPDVVGILGFDVGPQEAMREYWETFEGYHVEIEEVIYPDGAGCRRRPRWRAGERDGRRGVEPLFPRLDPS